MSVLSARHRRTADTFFFFFFPFFKIKAEASRSPLFTAQVIAALLDTPLPPYNGEVSGFTEFYWSSHTKRRLSQQNRPPCPRAECCQHPKIKKTRRLAASLVTFLFCLWLMLSVEHHALMCFLCDLLDVINRWITTVSLVCFSGCVIEGGEKKCHLRLIVIFYFKLKDWLCVRASGADNKHVLNIPSSSCITVE